MTPEDTNKIVEAIERQTEAVKSVRNYLIWGVILVSTMLVARATPLLPPLEQPVIVEIGDPPPPPPNPNLQYWYTMDVPGPDGVLPVEVFAPRLYSPVANVGPVELDVPEPGTWWLILAGLNLIAVWVIFRILADQLERWLNRADGEHGRYQCALKHISSCCHEEKCREIARKALEE